MKITDEVLNAAWNAWFGGLPEERHESLAYAKFIRDQLRIALTAALATQPDRYARGFEKAREMVMDLLQTRQMTDAYNAGRALHECRQIIRSMEMPDE